MSEAVLLSVVLPARGLQSDLDHILGDLRKNKQDGIWELIVVDDASFPALTLGDAPPDNWRLERTQENAGAARARNLGAERARGEYLVFLSMFLSLPGAYIERIKTFILETKFDFAQHPIEKAPDVPATHFQEYIANQSERISLHNNSPSIKQSLFTAAIIRRDVFIDLGGFDPAMQHYGGHEMDLIYRMDNAGYGNRVLIKEIPLQRVKVEEHKIIRSRLKEYGSTGLPALLKKHPVLKSDLLKWPVFWNVFSKIGLGRFLEKQIKTKIDNNIKMKRLTYRIYLHLVVRNAWDAR